jgi:putative transcriptional regulator
MSTDIDFRELVKEVRRVRGITQEQLARDLNVTFGTVNGWENGKHQPIPSLARRLLEIAQAAGVSPQSLAPREHRPSAGRSPRRRT